MVKETLFSSKVKRGLLHAEAAEAAELRTCPFPATCAEESPSISKQSHHQNKKNFDIKLDVASLIPALQNIITAISDISCRNYKTPQDEQQDETDP